jgi:hypothetical protein
MSRDPTVRRLVIIGYAKLLAILVGAAVLSIPLFLHPGLAGVRIAQVAGGVLLIGLIAWQTLRHEWNIYVRLTVLVMGICSIWLGLTITTANAAATDKQLLLLVVVVSGFVLLPRAALRGRSNPRK